MILTEHIFVVAQSHRARWAKAVYPDDQCLQWDKRRQTGRHRIRSSVTAASRMLYPTPEAAFTESFTAQSSLAAPEE